MKSILSALFSLFLIPASLYSQTKGEKTWLRETDFSFTEFVTPPLKYGPFTRWWWPGNDVTKVELKREIALFAENHFGGVEIQPFALVMPTKGAGRADRIMGYDTPSYYENLKFTLEEAFTKGITVDLTDGSGWPPGGPHLKKEDNNLTLEYGMVSIPKNSTVMISIPRAGQGDDKSAKLVALLAVKIMQDTSNTNQSFFIDPKNIKNITSQIKNNQFAYTATDKNWKAVAVWSIPTMETPMLIAKREAGFVFNHFDSTKVLKNYEYLFGDRTGLKPYYGKSLRAIFDDSYEFKANRHFSDDFISAFRKKRLYDITPYLTANLWSGYNNMYLRMTHPGLKPEFILSDQDWRLRYDYDLNLSDLLGEHFLKATKNWTESKGLLHRTQPYGLNMDIMASAGLASIPEVETMLFSKASENGYKLITSGAHLYNRPIISSETGVYINRAFMTTPQKLKLTIDKVLSSGVNQIIYHGTPYQYFPEGYPKEGWYPFYNSALGINFSTDLNESNPFWKYIKTINQYAQRAQYVLQSGKPQADVLIYYPFLNFSEEAINPREILAGGYLNTEPLLKAENKNVAYNREIDTEWLKKIIPLIDELNKKGITWDWINDASLKEMKLDKERKLDVRGNIYQSVILFDLPYIQLKSAQNLRKLSQKGADILLIGALPQIQPSFYNYAENDQLTLKEMETIISTKNSMHLKNLSGLDQWMLKLDIPILYSGQNGGFLRQTRRKISNSSYAQFIWNQSDTWQNINIKTGDHLLHAHWMNAEDGSIIPANKESAKYTYRLGPYSSIFLLTSSQRPNVQLTDKIVFDPSKAEKVSDINNWTLQAGKVQIQDTLLFDWKTSEKLKYNSLQGTYTATIILPEKKTEEHYFVDLGKVYYSADVMVNGKSAGSSIFTPFILDITKELKTGKNTISVTVTNANYNGFVGQAESGERVFKKLKGEDTMSAGLVGPVIIYKQKR